MYIRRDRTKAGVLQGDIISRLLFAILIDSISNNLQSSYHLSADELQIYKYTRIEDLDNAISTVDTD